MRLCSTAQKQTGFTIVELLVVIVVIAILASIAVVSYNGIIARAVDSTMKSDIQTAVSTVEIDYASNGSYPTTAALANNGLGLKTSGNNNLAYGAGGTDYCISITNPGSASKFRYKKSEGTIVSGGCTNDGVTTTLAGSTQGFANGTGAAAQFWTPAGVTVGPSGTVYIADTMNFQIRKITPDGVVTTLAGSTSGGFADGTGAAAKFNSPYAIVADASENLYVADTYNNRIRKVTPSGVVTTLAGSGASTWADGTGAAASFSGPQGISIDSAGVIYVADTGNSRIRKVTSSGVVTTLAGNGSFGYVEGSGATAQFNYPRGIAVDASGNVYVGDGSNYVIRKVTPAGVVSTFAGANLGGGYVDGPAASAQFDGVTGLTIDASGVLYAADVNNNRIRTISTTTGVVGTLAGSGTSGTANGTGTAAQFNAPYSVAATPMGTLYVADMNNSRIRKIE